MFSLLNDPRLLLRVYDYVRVFFFFLFQVPSSLPISSAYLLSSSSTADMSSLTSMSKYTKSGIRQFIDDLDGVVRKGVSEGKAKETFRLEMSRIVSFFFHLHFFLLLTKKIDIFDEHRERLPGQPRTSQRSSRKSVCMENGACLFQDSKRSGCPKKVLARTTGCS